jgi:hypothetical protein
MVMDVTNEKKGLLAFQHSGLFLKNVPNKGRGVFTSIDIPAGSLVELAPVIVLNPKDYAVCEKTVLYEYMFGWEKLGPDGGAIALGFGSLYNHAGKDANVLYNCLEDRDMVEYKATRDISAGEEVTINYCQRFDHESLWFEEAPTQ